MLTLTNIQLNLAHPEVQRDLADCHNMHRRTMRLFQHVNNTRDINEVLYVIDRIGAQWQLDIQALAYADVTSLPAGYALPPVRQRDDCDEQLAQLQPAGVYRFRLTANVTKKSIHIAKRVSLTERAEQIDWLDRKAESAGFTINPADLSITPEPMIMGIHPNGTLRYDAVRFAGTLTVVDAALVRQTVIGGIGAAKSYGCGLLRIGAVVHLPT